jgi:hypothetical protein
MTPVHGQRTPASPGRATASTLSQRLQELEETRRKGLISDDEYQRMRQKTIEKWG